MLGAPAYHLPSIYQIHIVEYVGINYTIFNISVTCYSTYCFLYFFVMCYWDQAQSLVLAREVLPTELCPSPLSCTLVILCTFTRTSFLWLCLIYSSST
jgi:hypothetical protein